MKRPNGSRHPRIAPFSGSVTPSQHASQAQADVESTPLYRRSLITIMACGIVVLLWTGGVFERMRTWAAGPVPEPHIQLDGATIPLHPAECSVRAGQRTVVHVEADEHGRLAAKCIRYYLLRPPPPRRGA